MHLVLELVFYMSVIVCGSKLDTQTKKFLCKVKCANPVIGVNTYFAGECIRIQLLLEHYGQSNIFSSERNDRVVIKDPVFNGSSIHTVNRAADMTDERKCVCGTIANEILPYDAGTSYDLVCKSDDMLAIKLRHTLIDKSYYVMEKKMKHSEWKYDSYGIIDESQVFSISNLENKSLYKMKIFVVEKDKIIKSVETKWIKTRAKNIKPLPVKELKSTPYFTENSSYAVIEWVPAEDLSCYYFMACVSSEDDIPIYIRNPNTLFKHVLRDIEYNETYKIAINAHNSVGLESEPREIEIITPSCTSVHHNLSMCVPDMPCDVRVEEIPTTINISYYDLKVSWSRPELMPDWYDIWFTSLSEDVTAAVNASGDSSNAIISGVKIQDLYHISIRAWSSVGASETATYTGRVALPSSTTSTFLIISCSIGLFLVVCGCAVVSILVNYKIANKRKANERSIYFQDLDGKSPAIMVHKHDLGDCTKDEWEIDPKDIVLQKVIGQGAFGVVRYAVLNKGRSQIEVAAKTLKNSPTNEEFRHFQQELETMKSVGVHPHLVSLIGICLHINSGPILVVEYCSRGDLQNYLNTIWEKLMCTPTQMPDKQVDKSAQEFDNKLYNAEPINVCNNELITSKDLLSFARQIAKGMEYLSKLKILHRDLAARNVLICEDMIIKISDFGLSRDVYKDNIYRKKAGGKLPIRWMAIECLTHQKYTIYSDVWSFGIVLWEIVTLGGNPYPGIATEDLLQLLKAGYRMECPMNIKQEIYDIMLNCWKANPRNRPTFTQIRKTLETFLENEVEYLQVDLHVHPDMNNSQISNYKNVETRGDIFQRTQESTTANCSVMPGKRLDSKAQELMLNVLGYFEREKENGSPLLPLSAVYERSSEALAVSPQTISVLK